MSKCPSSIQCWDLNPRPNKHESSPITTTLWLPPRVLWCLVPQLLLQLNYHREPISLFDLCLSSSLVHSPATIVSKERFWQWRWMWLNFQSGRLWYQRSVVRIQLSAKFKMNIPVQTVEKTKIKINKRTGMALL